MRIKYSPLIDKQVLLQNVTEDLSGNVTINGTIAGRPAHLIMSVQEAVLVYRELKKMDVEALERVYA